ncbi:MAG: methyltransferase domain-containing protein [Rickettsiales bacterium]|nr:methyltransferase domain-containing protein [Rickettsiales bacterium]
MPSEKLNLKNWLPTNKLANWQELPMLLFRAVFSLSRGFVDQQAILKNNLELGIRHFKLGHAKDAIMRLKIVVWLDSKQADAWYYMGRSYLLDRKPAKAAIAFKKALKLKPANDEYIYMAAVASGKKTPPSQLPRSIPLPISLEYFDQVAADYNKVQLEQYEYQGHVLLTDAIRAALLPGRIDHVVLDLGAGTGLCGVGLRDVSSDIVGIDFSAKMLDQAMARRDESGRKLYDALITKDIRDYLNECEPAAYDVILSAGAFSYLGELDGIFRAVANVIRPGGVFAFTTEKMNEAGFRFFPDMGAFKYSRSYIEALATTYGLTIIRLDEAEVYPGYKMWLCVLKK